jgi:hypothetical protein
LPVGGRQRLRLVFLAIVKLVNTKSSSFKCLLLQHN